MLEIVPTGLHIDFLGKAKLGIALSIVVLLAGLSAIVWRGGVKQGVDFSGGTLIQLRLSQPADLGTVREALEADRNGAERYEPAAAAVWQAAAASRTRRRMCSMHERSIAGCQARCGCG